MEEIYFFISMENELTIAFREEKNVNDSNVVSERKELMIIVRIRGGPTKHIVAPILIF